MFTIGTVKRSSVFSLPGQCVWCGSPARDDRGIYHLFYSLWPRAKGHDAWVTDSVVGHARADQMMGPYTDTGVTLAGSGVEGGWDRDVIHNPTVLYENGTYYLYYTGNFGNGEYWSHRNNQRVGVAISKNPEGPWQRFDKPLLDVNPEGWDKLITTNPSVTKFRDRYVMVYKAADTKAPGPMFGPVMHGVAFADNPCGPFHRHPEPIFRREGANFAGEDPFVFAHNGRLYVILKDMGAFYTPHVRGLVLFSSEDGLDWQLEENPLVLARNIRWEDGAEEELHRIERPQLYSENGKPKALFCAVKPHDGEEECYNLRMEVSFQG